MKLQSEGEEIKVFISSRESSCDECGEELGSKAWITLAGDKGALCLSCADLDHLLFLPSGNVALTRRARKHSTLFAVVLKWSRARKRYERQGLLVEAQALEKAEEEYLADEDIRGRRRGREATRREELDRRYVDQFAARVRELFPGCPAGREREIGQPDIFSFGKVQEVARYFQLPDTGGIQWECLTSSDIVILDHNSNFSNHNHPLS